MCGIYFEKLTKPEIYLKEKKNFIKKYIHNRGPDNFLYKSINSRTILSNSILSITGETNKKKELFSTQNKRYLISFNGQIYNYLELAKKYKIKNLSNCDTEVLIKLHEILNPYEISRMLDGMFSYVLYDNKKNKVYIVNDPSGEKRLFYSKNKFGLFISSNPNAILKNEELELKINYKILSNYLKTRHLMQYTETIYENIKLFEPGKIYDINLNTLKFKSKYFDDPLAWIDAKKYYNFQKQKEDEVYTSILSKFKETIQKLLPKNKAFGAAFSGGIDSSIIGNSIQNFKNFKFFYCLNHLGKDTITSNIYKFQNFLKKRILTRNIRSKDYFRSIKKSYKMLNFPFITHDMPGYNNTFNFFNSKKIKVIYWGGGADELCGGYSYYKKLKNYRSNCNISPYSKMNNINYATIDKAKSEIMWLKAYKKYKKFCKNTEAKIQATLFTDYFFGSISTHSISLHILSGENSVELRNPFMNKVLIQQLINLPLKYKINFNLTKNLQTKVILKKIFISFFNKKLIFPKQGFSGFPNETFKYLKSNEKKELNAIFVKEKIRGKAMKWKLINLFHFKRLIYKDLDLKKIFVS